MSKYENVESFSIEVDGFAGEVKMTYVPNRIDSDGSAFGRHLKSCEVSLTDPSGQVWCAELGASGGGGGSWSAASTEFFWKTVERVGGTLVLGGDEVTIFETYNARNAFSGGWSTSRRVKHIEVVLE
ncbi:hypothetical protein H6784_04175 [Candidatus Nomurabacteria bacterium]|nr:hypothetical protein [Candidatus Nomurabacteria bacterium]